MIFIHAEPRFESGEMITAEDDTKEICILGGSTAVAVILSSSDYCVDGYPQYTYDACGMLTAIQCMWWLYMLYA